MTKMLRLISMFTAVVFAAVLAAAAGFASASEVRAEDSAVSGGETGDSAAESGDASFFLTPAKDDDNVYIYVNAAADMRTLGFSCSFTYDESAFSLAGFYPQTGYMYSLNSEDRIIAMDSMDSVQVSEGDLLFVLVFRRADAFSKKETYRFGLHVTEAYGEDMIDYPWAPADLSTEYTDADVEKIVFVRPDAGEYYVVTFADEDGTVLSMQTVDPTDPYVVTYTPERSGAVFAGWLADGAIFDDTEEITGDVTLVASWEAAEEPDTETGSEGEKVVFEKFQEIHEDEGSGAAPVILLVVIIAAAGVCAALALRKRRR